MTTLKELAQRLGLSPATVSRALSGHPAIGKATSRRVHALAKELEYWPNELAANLRKGRSQTLGVIVPHLCNNFFPRIVQGMEDAATAAGYRLLICQSAEDAERERQCLATLLHARVEGVLVSVARTTAAFAPFEQVQQRGLPLVFFDRFLTGSDVSAVVIDDRAGGYQATRHLLAQGYHRVAHLTGPQHLRIYRNRRLGYEDALREANVPLVAELIVHSDLRLADGVHATERLLALPQPPDALFSASDFAALGCLQALKAQDARVPPAFGVIGYSDEFFCQYTEPALSSVDQRSEQLGRRAVQQLLELKLAAQSVVAHQVMLQPVLQIRSSSVRQPSLVSTR